MVIVFRDISGARQAERERQEAQEQVIAILDSIPDAFMRLDASGRIVQVNRMFERRFGKSQAALLGRHFREFHPCLCDGELEQGMQRALERRETIEIECRDDESGNWYVFKLCPTGTVQLGVFIQDITTRKKVEGELRDSQHREMERAGELEAVLRATPAAIFIAHDRYCHMITGNPASYRILGMEERENVSASAPERMPETRGFREFRDGVPLQPDELPLQVAVASGRDVESAELTLAFEDGRVRTIYGNAAPLFGPDGRSRGAIAAFVDITALKQAQQQLQDADRRKDEFLATLAHELRNPLAPISNAAQFLKLRGLSDPSLGWGIDVIGRQVQTMARLLDDLLDVSRISRNKLMLRRERIDLASVIARAVETSRPLIDMAGHELTISLPDAPVMLDADPMRLAQVFSNLLNNAAKYTESGGHIRLTAATVQSEAEVCVEDNGIGIAPEMLPRLFQIFSQAEPALERSRGGLGIGLSLVRGLVEMHSGSITAYSAGPGCGSRFVVRLPLLTPETEHPDSVAAHGAAPTALPLSVLVADDNRDSADTMASMLEAVGYQVLVAYDGEEAVVLAERHRPAIALLDIGMPRRNGYEVCRHLRSQPWGPSMCIIALTGWGQEADRHRAVEAGFDHHLVKPVEPATILELLASLHAPAASDSTVSAASAAGTSSPQDQNASRSL
jgi:PAS domain S-box-containing protein